MDLLEYQAKELFREMGIPVLPSQRIDHPRELRGLQIPYPVVLKSQVRAGGRGMAGGIRFAENTIDAIAAARTIFNLPILGEYPQVLLAEAKYNADREFYLAVVLDYTARRPVLLGSPQGGMDVEIVTSRMQQVVVDQDFSPYYARRLAIKMGLQGALIAAVSTIIEKMYQLFIQKDLDGLEINPLGVSATGEVMALDGKVTVNDAALGRHPELIAQLTQMPQRTLARVQSPQLMSLHCTNREGNIGILCNGTALGMAMVDLVQQAGGKPNLCLIASGTTRWDIRPTSVQEQLKQGLEQLSQNPHIKVVLVNILGSPPSAEEVAAVIVDYVQCQVSETVGVGAKTTQTQRERGGERRPTFLQTRQIHFVVRLVGEEIAQTQEHSTALLIHWIDNLDDAVAMAVSLAKSTAKK